MSQSLTDRLLHALLAIHSTPPRLIATPPAIGAATAAASKKRASVAIIIRIRPQLTTPPEPASPAASPTFLSFRTSSNTIPPSAHSPPNETAISSSANSPFTSAPGSAASPRTATDKLPSDAGVVGGGAGGMEGAGGAGVVANLSVADQLDRFFAQDWVRDGVPEVLYIKRASRSSDRWSAHVAFPGGRQEPDDEGSLYTAMRETWEEVGVDLAEKEYLCVGQLDDREITTSLGKRLLMILSPFVFLHTSPHCPPPDLQPSEVASAHWVPLSLLHSPQVRWGDVKIDISSRLAPRSPTIRWILRVLIGNMHFRCVLLPNEPVAVGHLSPEEDLGGKRPDLKLWGLTLGMTLDLISQMAVRPGSSSIFDEARHTATYPYLMASAGAGAADENTTDNPSSRAGGGKVEFFTPSTSRAHSRRSTGQFSLGQPPPISHLAPSMTSIFPTFSYPDVNFWIWCFGWRYRDLVRRWSEKGIGPDVGPNPSGSGSGSASGLSTPGGGRDRLADRQVNWAGMALGQFYAAVRRALVVAIIFRATVALGGLTALGMWMAKRIKERRATGRRILG